MAIKYVEDYRQGTLSDAATIQAAIDDLNDGDTLYFNKKETVDGQATNNPGTYVLTDPIQFTSCGSSFDSNGNYSTSGGKDRRNIVINGLGCTIKNSDGFSNYDGAPKKKYQLFILSDKDGHGLIDSIISNFTFEENKTSHKINEETGNTPSIFTAVGAIGAVSNSTYTKRCVFSNCEFKVFKTGLYMAGESCNVTNCIFNSCNVGINADCPNYGRIFSNKFYNIKTGIDMTKPIWSEVYSNFFYDMRGDSISVSGTSSREFGDTKEIYVSIYSNIIKGSSTSGSQRGIFISGVKDLMIKDNYISGMYYKEGNDSNGDAYYENYGIGIYVTGLVNYNTSDGKDNVRLSRRCIVSGNEIRNCKSCGIKINYTYDSLFSNNTIYGDPDIPEDSLFFGRGIFVDTVTSGLRITSNALYYYENGNGIFNYTNTANRITDNAIIRKELYHTVTGTISSNDSNVIIIPNSIILEDNEYVFVEIPSNYHSEIGMSFISYQNDSSSLYKEDNTYADLTDYAGSTVKLLHNVVPKSSFSEEIGFKFTLVN